MKLLFPAITLAPLEYRYALDAAMTVLAPLGQPLVISNLPELVSELRWRVPGTTQATVAPCALWVEPLVGSWSSELAELARSLTSGAALAVVASRPQAATLPERQLWSRRALGMQRGGVARLRYALRRAGFSVTASYGIHSPVAVALNMLGRCAEAWGRPDLGDRLQFAARMRYCVSGPLAGLCTVALVMARKEVVP